VVPIGQTYEAVLTVQVTTERFCLRFYYTTSARKTPMPSVFSKQCSYQEKAICQYWT
jgi:hypothetical protein